MIRKFLLSGASLNVPDHKGNTALHIAAQFSSTKSLEELALYVPMQTLLEVATTRNNEGQTCVHVAARYGNSDVLRKLKSYGVNIDMQVSNNADNFRVGLPHGHDLNTKVVFVCVANRCLLSKLLLPF